MSFNSLNRILNTLEQQSRWQYQPFQRLLKCWTETVGVAVATHTRPISIQRDVLCVATSSAAWAQTLTFERPRILQKLNSQLPSPLVDIRFSTAQWQHSKATNLTAQAKDLSQEHPSFFLDKTCTSNSKIPSSKDPNATFECWAKVMQARSQGLPLCPQCQCPTPIGELQRWTICSICIAKQY